MIISLLKLTFVCGTGMEEVGTGTNLTEEEEAAAYRVGRGWVLNLTEEYDTIKS